MNHVKKAQQNNLPFCIPSVSQLNISALLYFINNPDFPPALFFMVSTELNAALSLKRDHIQISSKSSLK